MLRILAIIDGDDHHTRRGERPVHEIVFISTDVLSHPGPTMNIQDGWEWAASLWLVDRCLERFPTDVQIIDILCMNGKRQICRC